MSFSAVARERSASFTDPPGRPAARNVTVTLQAPQGWSVSPALTARIGTVRPGVTATVRWRVHATSGAQPAAAVFSALARYRQGGRADAADAAAIVSVPPPPPTGTVFVSSLDFLSATNGWGPVERDTSNGENQPGDGHPITLNGTQYAKGLGVNASSDIAVYLGGNYSRFTATVGVDDEVGNRGSVTFSVAADGRTLSTTPVLTGSSASVGIDQDVTGAQRLRPRHRRRRRRQRRRPRRLGRRASCLQVRRARPGRRRGEVLRGRDEGRRSPTG